MKISHEKICATRKLHIYLQPYSCAFKYLKMSKRDIFQAIADPTRRGIIELVSKESLTPNAIADSFEMSRQAVSKHIKVLYECDLLSIEQIGRERYYRAQTKKLKEVADWLEPYRRLWESRYSQLDDVLNQLKHKKHGK